MHTKLVFGLWMAMGMIGNAEAADRTGEKMAKVYFYTGKANLKKIPLYKATGFDPFLYSGRFPWGRFV